MENEELLRIAVAQSRCKVRALTVVMDLNCDGMM